MIIQIADAVSSEDCDRLIQTYIGHIHLTEMIGQREFPVVYWHQVCHSDNAAKIVPRLVENCLRMSRRQLPHAEQLYPETVILAAMSAGGHHSRHADNCRLNEHGDWVANHTPNRDVSAIYYLNDEVDGGEIVFDLQQLVVKPRRRLLLAFPSDAAHVHEVLPVWSGVRYTMAIWFTKQPRYALADFPRSEVT